MPRRLLRWSIGVGITGAVLTATGLIVQHWMDGSNTGTVQHGNTSDSRSTPQAPQSITIKTSYFVTTLPASFSVKKQVETPDTNPTLVQFTADTGSDQNEEFALTYGTTPAEGLGGLGNYNLRVTQTALYSSYSPAKLPSGAVAFRSTTAPAAFTVFWPHDTHYVELSFTNFGSDSYDGLVATYNQVIADWSWKQ